MGRRRSTVTDLPPNVHMKGPTYYYVVRDGGNRLWLRLGRDRERSLALADEYRVQFDTRPEDRQLREEVMKRDGFACRYCGATSDLEIDHVVPLSRGGANSERNTVVACRACNSNKRDAHPVDFVEHLYKFAP